MPYRNRKLIQWRWLLLCLQIPHLYWFGGDKKSNQMNFRIIEIWYLFIHSIILTDHYVPVTGDTFMLKADKNMDNLLREQKESVIIIYMCLYLTKQFSYMFLLFPAQVFTMRQILLFCLCRYANWCSYLKDGTSQVQTASHWKSWGSVLYIIPVNLWYDRELSRLNNFSTAKPRFYQWQLNSKFHILHQ